MLVTVGFAEAMATAQTRVSQLWHVLYLHTSSEHTLIPEV